MDSAWLEREVREANRLFAPHGIQVVVAEQGVLPARYEALQDARDRDALVVERKKGLVNVFVVRSLRDVDDPSRHILGVRWRLLRDVSQDYVILSTLASPTTLAHELGHLLGLDHSPVVDNVMSYRREDPSRLAFVDAQGVKMRKTARDLFRRGALRCASSGSAAALPCQR